MHRLLVRMAIILAAVLVSLPTPVKASEEMPDVTTIFANIARSVNMNDTHMTFKQQVNIRALLFRWQFTTEARQNDDGLYVEVGEGAPSWISDGVFTDLIDIQDALHAFDLRVEGEERGKAGEHYYIISGQRNDGRQSGALSGKLWVDSQDWYIAKAELAYTWGKLEVQQQYRTEKGLRVLHRQEGVARAWISARIDIDYGEYWFD